MALQISVVFFLSVWEKDRPCLCAEMRRTESQQGRLLSLCSTQNETTLFFQLFFCVNVFPLLCASRLVFWIPSKDLDLTPGSSVSEAFCPSEQTNKPSPSCAEAPHPQPCPVRLGENPPEEGDSHQPLAPSALDLHLLLNSL